jgi:hypothetical protein
VIFEPWNNINFSTYPPLTLIHLSHRFTSASKPAAQSISTVVSATSAPQFQPLRHQRNVCHVSRPSCEPLYMTDTSHSKQEAFLYEYPLHWVLLPTEKTHNKRLLRSITLLKHGRQFDYWNWPLNIRMRVCYLDCHEAGLCCYLVMHIENLLRPLQLICIHLWLIYWLSLV